METIQNHLQMPVSTSSKRPAKSDDYCDACANSGWTVIVGEGAKACDCPRGLQIVYRRTSANRELPVNVVPKMFERFRIETMLPDTIRSEKQIEVLAALKENPAASVVMFGKNSFGAGKSAIGWAIYNSAVLAGRKATGGKLSSFVRMMQAWEIDGAEPVVRPADFRLWDRGLVFFDEFGKVKQSEFSARMVFELLDVAYEEQQQIVIATNLSKDELKGCFYEIGEQYAGAIYRRLFDQEGVIAVNFGSEE